MENATGIKEKSKIMKKKDTSFHAVQSDMSLQSAVRKAISEVFKTALQCIEIKFGKDFEGYDELRKRILDVGNENIRKLERIITEDFNTNKLPDEMVTIHFKERK